ncbi:MAG TPA: alanine racemase [Bryobacteraceae bacterium]|nr:alanine racemase [Bryobacteraceae bacterium]
MNAAATPGQLSPASVTDLDTPALVIDLDIMERNLRRMAAYASQHGLRLRPHTKTHKIPALSRKQIDLGAAGLTVAKVGEAEVMAIAKPPNFLVAYPVIGRRKLERLMTVARDVPTTVSLDSMFVAQQLSDAAREGGVEIGVLAEVDVGLGRVGVSPAEIVQLAKDISRLPALRLDGIAFYPGHIKSLGEDGLKAIETLSELLGRIVADLKEAGLTPRIVSGGSTPTMWHSHKIEELNEIRPGTYLFNDRNTILSGACSLQDCAAYILATVVSTAKQGQMIIDGGSKTFSSDRASNPSDAGFGHLIEAPQAVFTKMNEEHGYVDIRTVDRGFKVGDRVRMIPNHICVAMNLHERVYGMRGGVVEQIWTVDARGKLQ